MSPSWVLWIRGVCTILSISVAMVTANAWCDTPAQIERLAEVSENFNSALTADACKSVRSTTASCQIQSNELPVTFTGTIDWLANEVNVTGENIECTTLTFALKESCLTGGSVDGVYTECQRKEGGSESMNWCLYECVCQTSCNEAMAIYGKIGGPETASICNVELLPVP